MKNFIQQNEFISQMKKNAQNAWNSFKQQCAKTFEKSQFLAAKSTNIIKAKFNEYHKRIPQKKYVAIVAGTLCITIIVSLIQMNTLTSNAAETTPKQTTKESTKKAPQTISPILYQDGTSLVILGTILSNESANIYPRREGIVKDILVDIGDQVKEGQIIATLLPRGVENQSEALIAEKMAKTYDAAASYNNAAVVSTKALEDAFQQLKEKKTALATTKQSANASISKAQTVNITTRKKELAKYESSLQQIEVAKASLREVQEMLEKTKIDSKNKLKEAEQNIKQTQEQAEVAVLHAKQIIEQTLLGEIGATGKTPLQRIDPSDLPSEISALNPQLRIDMAHRLNDFLDNNRKFSLLDEEMKLEKLPAFIEEAESINKLVENMLDNTIVHANFPQEKLTRITNRIHDTTTKVLKAKESIEDAKNRYTNIESSEEKLITGLETKIEKLREIQEAAEKGKNIAIAEQEKNTESAKKELEKIETIEDSKIILLREKVESAKKRLEYIKSQQKQMVDKARTTMGVANASLKLQESLSGHQEIRSPFTGIVSKRLIEVGSMVMPQKVAFELTDVQTTLAKKAKREIEFGLPEELNEKIQIGDIIEFFLPEKESLVLRGQIVRKSPQVDSTSHTITTRAKIADVLKFPHHTSVRVRLTTNKEKIYRIPSKVIRREKGKNYIWILKTNSTPKSTTEEGMETAKTNSSSKENETTQTDAFRKQINVISEDGEFAEVTGKIDEETQILKYPPDKNDT